MAESQVYSFKDEKPVPDIVVEYPASLRQNKVPIVIDNGIQFILCVVLLFQASHYGEVRL